MTRYPPQEDVREDPQPDGAQNGSSILESSHGGDSRSVSTKRQFIQRRARAEAGLGREEAVDTFVPSTSELGADQTFRRPRFFGVASLAIRNLETSHN
jgi:hypothetical protein